MNRAKKSGLSVLLIAFHAMGLMLPLPAAAAPAISATTESASFEQRRDNSIPWDTLPKKLVFGAMTPKEVAGQLAFESDCLGVVFFRDGAGCAPF